MSSTVGFRTAPTTLTLSTERSWSWGESNPRPSGCKRPCYDHSRLTRYRSETGGSADRHKGGPRSVFAECQQTFMQSAVFLAVIPRFCCRAAVDRPRAPFLVTMSLRSPNQAARANCSLAILFFAPFSESEQLGSHARPQKLMSKPVSPMFDCSSSLTANECFRRPRGGTKHSVEVVR